MKKRCALLLALLTLATSEPQALAFGSNYGRSSRYCDPCFDPCCKPCYGRIEGGGELLYFSPATCDLLYAISDPRTFEEILAEAPTGATVSEAANLPFPQLRKHSVRPRYEFGFRAFLSWVACDCFDGTVEYMRLHASRSDEIRAQDEGGLWPTFAHPQFIEAILYDPIDGDVLSGQVEAIARSRVCSDFDSVELQLARRATLGRCCQFWARGFLAVHYFNLDYSFTADYQGTILPGEMDAPPNGAVAYEILTSRRSMRLWGVGPRIGVEGIYNVACGLGIAGRLGLGVMAGDERTRRHERIRRVELTGSTPETIDEVMDVSDTDRIQIVPRIDLRVGVNLTTCFSCAVVSAELGYEFISYLKALRESAYIVRAVSTDYCENFNMQGPYLRLLVGF